jgi:acyl-CoA synthetase (AMP-forming)/AMP-acid ligase II
VNTILSPKDYLSNPEKIKSVGKPAPGNFLKIIDEDGKECPPGVEGELCVMNILTRRLQYYKDPEKTRKSFVEIDGEKYYMEGEVAYRDEDGYLYIVDRKKDIIISGGVNIYPGEIEEVICSYPKVEDAAVIGVPDEEWGESIKALIVPKKGEEIGREEIILYCREKLAGYKKPKYVEFVEELPRSPDGKLLKRELRDRYRK